MFTNPLYILFTLALAVAVGLSAPDWDPCVLGCLKDGMNNTPCASLTDYPCICASAPFWDTLTNCLSANCTAQDQQTGVAFHKGDCGDATPLRPPTQSTASSPSSTSQSSGATTPDRHLPLLAIITAIVGVALARALTL